MLALVWPSSFGRWMRLRDNLVTHGFRVDGLAVVAVQISLVAGKMCSASPGRLGVGCELEIQARGSEAMSPVFMRVDWSHLRKEKWVQALTRAGKQEGSCDLGANGDQNKKVNSTQSSGSAGHSIIAGSLGSTRSEFSP